MLKFKGTNSKKKSTKKDSAKSKKKTVSSKKKSVSLKNKTVSENYRPDWDEYFMNITREVAKRSNCMSAHHGAIIVKNKTIISTGYNGAPRKTKDCYARGKCLRRELGIPSGHRYELCRSVHGEQNALVNAARQGSSVLGADLYIYSVKVFNEKEEKLIDAMPCFICKKMLINAGIKRVIYITKEGKIESVEVAKWQKDWQTKDMHDDLDLYDAKYAKK